MIQPIFNNILVKPQEAEGFLRSSEGLLTEIGKVIAVGEDVQRIKIGDEIAFSKWGVKNVEKDNEKYYFIPEDGRFILGIVSVS